MCASGEREHKERLSTNEIFECCIRNTVTRAAINSLFYMRSSNKQQQWQRRRLRRRPRQYDRKKTTQLIHRNTIHRLLCAVRVRVHMSINCLIRDVWSKEDTQHQHQNKSIHTHIMIDIRICSLVCMKLWQSDRYSMNERSCEYICLITPFFATFLVIETIVANNHFYDHDSRRKICAQNGPNASENTVKKSRRHNYNLKSKHHLIEPQFSLAR